MPQYRRRALVVEARQLLPNGTWKVTFASGHYEVVSAEEFAATYEPVSEAKCIGCGHPSHARNECRVCYCIVDTPEKASEPAKPLGQHPACLEGFHIFDDEGICEDCGIPAEKAAKTDWRELCERATAALETTLECLRNTSGYTKTVFSKIKWRAELVELVSADEKLLAEVEARLKETV